MGLVSYHRIVPPHNAVWDSLLKQLGCVESSAALRVGRNLVAKRVSLFHMTRMPHVVLSARDCASSDDATATAAARLYFLLTLCVAIDDNV